jgi:hypothetical protein
VLFGLSASSGASLADFSAPKIPRNSARFESKNFYKADFWLCKAQNAVNPFGFTSILTQQRQKSACENRVRIRLLCLSRKGGFCMQIVIVKSPKFFGGILRRVFKIKKGDNGIS